jgi:hypothetical protein
MGFSFRQSIHMGPLRLNLSQQGVGLSAGIRGARVSVGPRGTYVTVARGGFQYRAKLSDHVPASPGSVVSPALSAPGTTDPTRSGGYVFSASAAQLAETSPEQSLQELQRRMTSSAWFWAYAVAALLLLLLIPVGMTAGSFLAFAIVALVGCVQMYLWEREERTARILYDVDDPEILERMAMVLGAAQWLSRTNRLWHVYYSAPTMDWKHNAGASTLIQRTPTSCIPGALPRIELNIEPWCIPTGPQHLLFLPERMLVIEGHRLAGVPYEHLSVTCEHKRFIEEEYPPPDAPVLDRTWQYVNKSGGPDRRFSNNRQLPVLNYGRLELRSASGVNVVLQTSNPACAEGAAYALNALIARASSAQAAPTPLSHVQPRSWQQAGVLPPAQVSAPTSTRSIDGHRLGFVLAVGALVVLGVGATVSIAFAAADDAPAQRQPPAVKPVAKPRR